MRNQKEKTASIKRSDPGRLELPLLILGVIVFDQLSKWWIRTSFYLYESREVVPGFFNLTYVTNPGAAFGLLAGWDTWWREVFFIVVSLAALVALFLVYRHFRHEGRLPVYGLALITGGAAGNLIDRLRFGEVVDFLDFYLGSYHWPAFNVADAGITIGVGLLLLSGFRDSSRAEGIHQGGRKGSERVG